MNQNSSLDNQMLTWLVNSEACVENPFTLSQSNFAMQGVSPEMGHYRWKIKVEMQSGGSEEGLVTFLESKVVILSGAVQIKRFFMARKKYKVCFQFKYLSW